MHTILVLVEQLKILSAIITWFAVHCFSSVHRTQYIAQIQYTLESRHLWWPHRLYLIRLDRYFFNKRGNKIRHILLQQFHLITLHIKTVKHPCFSPWTRRNRVMFERRSVDFKTISAPFSRTRSKVLCVAIVTSWSWMGLWRHCWCRQWLGRVLCTERGWNLCMECPLQFTS